VQDLDLKEIRERVLFSRTTEMSHSKNDRGTEEDPPSSCAIVLVWKNAPSLIVIPKQNKRGGSKKTSREKKGPYEFDGRGSVSSKEEDRGEHGTTPKTMEVLKGNWRARESAARKKKKREKLHQQRDTRSGRMVHSAEAEKKPRLTTPLRGRGVPVENRDGSQTGKAARPGTHMKGREISIL